MAVDEPRVPLHQPLKVHEVAGRQGGLGEGVRGQGSEWIISSISSISNFIISFLTQGKHLDK